MRITKFLSTLARVGAISGALLLCSHAKAQELINAVRLNVDAGAWASDASWVLSGSDPAETGIPGEDEIASILNGGTATLSTEQSIHSLSIVDGSLDLATGGSLAVANQTIVGETGVLSLGGGSLNTDSLAVFGTIDLASDLAGSLSFGDSFDIGTAGSVFGNPSGFTVGGSAPALPKGLGLGLVSTDTGASVVVESIPILQVDRASGATSINNLAGGPIDIAGYSVLSNGELLRRTGGAWTSLEDQGIAGWTEANATRFTRLSEMNLTTSTQLGVGESWSLGTIYNGIGEAPSKEDLEFEVLLADGRIMSPEVEYLGAPNDLVLNVDPDSGAVTISNTSSLIDPFDVTAVSITSSSGSLAASNYTGIGEAGWVNANPQDNAITEVSLEGSKLFSTNTSADLGNFFVPGGEQDLIFRFSTSDNALRNGSIIYGVPPVVVACDPNSQGDLDGDGSVGFPDFLVLSANFGAAATSHTTGDIDCSGSVGFPDFLVLSANFGSTVGAQAASTASVPEPAGGLLLFLGVLGMLKFRRRAPQIAAVMVAAAVCCGSPQQASAVDFDTRFIRIHPDGPNNGINSVMEALAILDGNVTDALINEDLTGTLEFIDLEGGIGSFNFDGTAYLNGVNDDTMNNFLQYVSGTVEIPAGEYTIGCGSDDGCMVRFTDVTFLNTFNENGVTTNGDGEILFNAGRGHDWTLGTFTVPDGGVTTGFEAVFNEGGGGDSFEVAIFDEHITAAEVDTIENRASTIGLFLEVTDGALGWSVTGDPYARVAGDFNFDGVVNSEDSEILNDNFGDEGGFRDGDMNLDGVVNFHDVSLFRPILAAAPAGAALTSVPEPSSVSLIFLGVTALLGLRRRQRA